MESGIRAAHDREQKAGFREVLETDGLGAGEPGDVPDRGLEGWIDGGATRPNGGSGEVTDRARRAGQGQVLGNSRKTSFQDSVVSHPAVSLPGPGGGWSGSVQAGPRGGPSASRSQYTDLRPSPDDLPALSREDEALQECPGAWRLLEVKPG